MSDISEAASGSRGPLRVALLGRHGGNVLAYSIATVLALRDLTLTRGDAGGTSPHAELLWVFTTRTPIRVTISRFARAVPRLQGASQRFGGYHSTLSHKMLSEAKKQQSLFRLLRLGESVHLEELGVTVRGMILPTPWPTYVARRIRYFLTVLWWGMRFSSSEFQQRLLRASIAGIHVGDLVASAALTTQHRLTRGIRSAINVSACLTQASAILNSVLSETALRDVDYAMSAEHTYLPMVLPRALGTVGVPALLETRTDAIYVGNADLGPGEHPGMRVRHQMRVPQPVTVPCSGQCQHQEFVRRRMALLRSHDGDEAVEQLRRIVVPAQSFGVLFLHDFGDGQFFYGSDEFGDLFSWTRCALDNLLDETDVVVLVKPHSIVKETYRRLNQAALVDLRRRYSDEPRVQFLDVPASPQLLAEALEGVDWFGVTHHGTVSEELPILGRACVASHLGPWGDAHDFAWRYSSKSELRDLLRDAPELNLRPDWESELCVYLQRRYGDMTHVTFKGRGPHEVARMIDAARGQSSPEVHSMDEWRRSNSYLIDATPSDPVMLKAVREFAASRVDVLAAAIDSSAT